MYSSNYDSVFIVFYIDPLLLITLSDLFVNLSAGWFGAAIIVPLTEPKLKLKLWVLTTNLLFGILFLF